MEKQKIIVCKDKKLKNSSAKSIVEINYEH